MGFPFSYASFKIQQDFIRYFLGLALLGRWANSLPKEINEFKISQSIKWLVKLFWGWQNFGIGIERSSKV